MSGLLLVALTVTCVAFSAAAVTLRGGNLIGNPVGMSLGHPRLDAVLKAVDDDEAQHIEARSRLTAATMTALLTGDISEADVAGTFCYVNDLLNWSDNVDVQGSGTVAVDDFVIVRCKLGFLPPPGRSDTISVTCHRDDLGKARFDTESRLSCGLPCHNSQLVSQSGSPMQTIGMTAPQGLVEMRCALQGMLPVFAECQPDGTWSTPQPCMPCDTSALALREPRVQLSAYGMLLPQSQVQMRCPVDMFAYPSATVSARCLPGGTWGFSALSCRTHGCDTATFLPAGVEGGVEGGIMDVLGASVLEVDREMEGRLAVGAQIVVRQVRALAIGMTSVSYTATCQDDGTWFMTSSPQKLILPA